MNEPRSAAHDGPARDPFDLRSGHAAGRVAWDVGPWAERAVELAARVRRAARQEMSRVLERPSAPRGDDDPTRPVRAGAGDVTYRIDDVTERAVEQWLDEVARGTPISLLTEDSGWRHRGPGPRGVRDLNGFDHGGPRLALDPIDGTRGLMHDLRSAWTVVSLAGPGAAAPRLSDLELGLVAEIPDSRAARARELRARAGGPCEFLLRDLDSGCELARRTLASDSDDRPDHGFFPFFRYDPRQRPALARVEAAFFERLARAEGADLRHVFDDQYISNAGQLVLLALGTYRMVADLRALLGRRSNQLTTTSKPYDLAGAVLVAQRAGCVVTAGDGRQLDFELDCSTAVDFVGWANAPTHARLAPHLAAALAD